MDTVKIKLHNGKVLTIDNVDTIYTSHTFVYITVKIKEYSESHEFLSNEVAEIIWSHM